MFCENVKTFDQQIFQFCPLVFIQHRVLPIEIPNAGQSISKISFRLKGFKTLKKKEDFGSEFHVEFVEVNPGFHKFWV